MDISNIQIKRSPIEQSVIDGYEEPIRVNNSHVDYIKSNYSLYSKQIQTYMLSVFNSILDRYDEIPSEWYVQLDQLAFQQYMMEEAKKDILSNGITSVNVKGGAVPNPSVKIYNDGMLKCDMIIKQFGLNPRSNMFFKSDSVDTSAVLSALLD